MINSITNLVYEISNGVTATSSADTTNNPTQNNPFGMSDAVNEAFEDSDQEIDMTQEEIGSGLGPKRSSPRPIKEDSGTESEATLAMNEPVIGSAPITESSPSSPVEVAGSLAMDTSSAPQSVQTSVSSLSAAKSDDANSLSVAMAEAASGSLLTVSSKSESQKASLSTSDLMSADKEFFSAINNQQKKSGQAIQGAQHEINAQGASSEVSGAQEAMAVASAAGAPSAEGGMVEDSATLASGVQGVPAGADNMGAGNFAQLAGAAPSTQGQMAGFDAQNGSWTGSFVKENTGWTGAYASDATSVNENQGQNMSTSTLASTGAQMGYFGSLTGFAGAGMMQVDMNSAMGAMTEAAMNAAMGAASSAAVSASAMSSTPSAVGSASTSSGSSGSSSSSSASAA